MTTSERSLDAETLLTQAQACVDHMMAGGDAASADAADKEATLVASVATLLQDDPEGVLPQAMAQGTTAAHALAQVAWSYAECLEWQAQDGPFEQQMFVVPMLVAADQMVPGFVKDAVDPKAFEGVISSLKKSGLVHQEATVWMVPYFYQTEELDSLSPSEVYSINRAGFKDVQTFYDNGGLSFDPTEPVWHFNTATPKTIDGTVLQLRYLVGGVVDRSGRAASIVGNPESEAAEERQTQRVMRWSKGAMKPLVDLFGAQEVFVMSPVRFGLAVSEGITMHNAVGFATTLDYHLGTLHLQHGDVECDVQFSTDVLPAPGEKPDAMDVVSLLLDVYDKDGDPNDPPIFQYTWPRPGDDPSWMEVAIEEVKSSGISLRHPDKPSALRAGTVSPFEEFSDVDPAKIARAVPGSRRLQ